MPFRAVCPCGFEVEGDCTRNGHLAVAPSARHLHIENGRIVCDQELDIRPVEIRPPGFRHVPAIHASERCVVWRHPATGEIAYPGQNNVPMPERYRTRGFERHELSTLRSIDRFEREHNVRNERVHYDSNGKAD